MTVLVGLFCRICQIVRLRFTSSLPNDYDFPPILDNSKVVGTEFLFHVEKYQNLFPSGFKYTKRIICSAAVMSSLECCCVRTLGSDVGLPYSMYLL